MCLRSNVIKIRNACGTRYICISTQCHAVHSCGLCNMRVLWNTFRSILQKFHRSVFHFPILCTGEGRFFFNWVSCWEKICEFLCRKFTWKSNWLFKFPFYLLELPRVEYTQWIILQNYKHFNNAKYSKCAKWCKAILPPALTNSDINNSRNQSAISNRGL